MAKAAVKKVEFINPVEFDSIRVKLVGTSPLIMHRFSKKAWEELLYPSGRTNEAARAENLKHDPIQEYRQCFYRNRDEKAPSLFHVPNGGFHGALCAAALDIPGAVRTKLERLTRVDLQVNLFGRPTLFMAMVRNSDQNRTPDVRTRPIFEHWACELTIRFMVNPLNAKQIINLLSASGEIVGVGDWRPQRGGSFGCYRIANANDREFKDIVAKQGRAAQQKAYDHPDEYDEDSAEMMAWFTEELHRRGAKKAQGGNGKEMKIPAPRTKRGVVDVAIPKGEVEEQVL